MAELFVDMTRCTACRACEIACVAEHSHSDDAGARDFSADPNAIEDVERGIRLQVAPGYARFECCLHCSDAPCVDACPNGAMKWDPDLQVVFVDQDRCQGCLMCAMMCPFGAISLHPTSGIALKCDGCRDRVLLGKKPRCLEACTTGALSFDEPNDRVRGRRRDAARLLAESLGSAKTVAADAPRLAITPATGEPKR